jgi:uncharacterized protein involved in exopolysaccharide biosynthesis
MELYRIWRILADHWRLIIWLPIIATLAGLAVSYVLPEVYESTALVLVRPFEAIKFNTGGGPKKEILDFPVTLSAPVDAPSKTYKEVINSTATAVKIVDALHLDIKKPKLYENRFEEIKDQVRAFVRSTLRTVRNYFEYGREIPASPYELAVEDVEKNLIVSARKDTYAFAIAYRSSDPKEAAAVANTAAEIFREQSSEAYRSEQASAREILEKQVEESRNALEQARAAIFTYKNSGGTFELNSEYDEKLKSVTDLENSLAKAEAKLAGRRLLATRTHINEDPVVIEEEAEIEELKRQISALRVQLPAYPKKETQMNALTLAERIAKENYEFYRKQYEEARAKESAVVSEIRIVSRAMPTLYPVKPIKYIYAVASFATALVLAVGWALFVDAVDPRVRTVRDLDDKVGVPVLGVIPAPRRSRWTARA